MDETIGGALALLKKHKIKLLPVTDSDQRLRGVVTRADLQPLDVCILPVEQALHDVSIAEKTRHDQPVSRVMSTSVTTLQASTRLTDVIPIFMNKGHHHLPVLQQDDRVVGMLTQADIVAVMCGRGAPE